MEQKIDLLKNGGGGYLENNFLIAMPGLNDSLFGQSVILICAHSDEGAMGFVLNKQSDMLFSTFMKKLRSETKAGSMLPEVSGDLIPVHVGGPVDGGRGFVLHTSDYSNNSTMMISDSLAVTSTLDILSAVSNGKGPEKAILCLGYAGWSPGQLEEEVSENSWLSCPLYEDAIFEPDLDQIYTKTLASMGVELAMLSSMSGHA